VQGAQGEAALGREGWLVWGGGTAALRMARATSAGCPQAGELVLQLYRADAALTAPHALVTAYPAHGAPRSQSLAPGSYRIPAVPEPSAEDQALFEQLRARSLVRLGEGGLAELAPPDLAAWRAAPAARRDRTLDSWRAAVLDDEGRRLLARLYRQADGAFVREQVRVFNAERRLLAWRMADGATPGSWQASVGDVPAASAASMPVAAARLFASLPQGWGPWTRVANWPASSGTARLTLTLEHSAAAAQTLRILLAGRLKSISGATLQHAPVDRCSGRACPAQDAVRELELALVPGARSVALDVEALDMSAIAAPADQDYRHLRVAGGRLEWQALPASGPSRRAAAVPVSLADRNGKPLWSDGAPSAAAAGAGLATLLGVRAEQANSVAGMLARLPAPSGAHQVRLTLDLALQAASQAALECIGMRHGRWDKGSCSGGAPAPAGRQAGIVVLDTETGDLLAAAGARSDQASGAGWTELRDFDRADPARSPLRLPALQHDGGSNNSPGSTFKVISALGLELAARRDRQLDALLDGLPLARIDRIASERGFAFRTGAAAYPEHTRLAHITNFRQERLDERAEDGRLGLAQALTYSLNTWFAWTGELSDRSLFGRPEGGAPGLQALEPAALAPLRPIVDMARRLGFERALRLDGGLLPADFPWSPWDALQGTPAHIDPIHARHELRQMAIGLRMQATPLQMALAAGAVGQGRVIEPRLLLELDGRQAAVQPGPALGVRLDRIRAGMKGVVDAGTAASAFRGARFDALRRGLYGKTGTAPTGQVDAAGHELSTVWFTCWLEPGSLPGQTHRLALSAYVSHSATTGGEHAAPIVAAVLESMQAR
jgi:cell division protein FtsI/penicillin-binding protein 2